MVIKNIEPDHRIENDESKTSVKNAQHFYN